MRVQPLLCCLILHCDSHHRGRLVATIKGVTNHAPIYSIYFYQDTKSSKLPCGPSICLVGERVVLLVNFGLYFLTITFCVRTTCDTMISESITNCFLLSLLKSISLSHNFYFGLFATPWACMHHKTINISKLESDVFVSGMLDFQVTVNHFSFVLLMLSHNMNKWKKNHFKM